MIFLEINSVFFPNFIHLSLVLVFGKTVVPFTSLLFSLKPPSKMSVREASIKTASFFCAQEQGVEVTSEHLGRLYVFSLMWSIGALLELEGRRRLEHWLCSQEALTLDLPPLEGTEDTMFDYYVSSTGEDPCFHGLIHNTWEQFFFHWPIFT